MNIEPTDTRHNLKKWHEGDKAGLGALLERNISWIQARVRKRLGAKLRQRLESCDVVQDAALQFLQYGPRFLISDEKHFRALLARIVENTLRDKNDWYEARRRAITLERPLPTDTVLYLSQKMESIPTPSKDAQRHEEEAWIRLGIELLDPDEREVLVLHQWDHMSFADIGKQLNIKPESAWKRHKRAVKKLAIKIGDLRRGDFSSLEDDYRSGE
jgi:RNA polymerase sigma-70 factor (ECF subfamily)